jgi:hypothetical protein
MTGSHGGVRFLVVLSLVAISCGCSTRWPLDGIRNDFAPIDLSSGLSTERVISDEGSPWKYEIFYDWKTSTGSKINSSDVVREINAAMDFDEDQIFPTNNVADSFWYWLPDLSSSEHYDAIANLDITGRPSSVIVLGLKPTVAIVIERPTFYASRNRFVPFNGSYWSWNRIVLKDGIADGVAVPSEGFGEDGPAAKLIVPSRGIASDINIASDGVCDLGFIKVKWNRVIDDLDRHYLLFSFSE